ncbi:MAG: UbiD family decarboxylase [Gammaproteobacteria bacterium]|nr:UbiD family decarboxylase [Gammaproteobacteria bacterium]
MHDFRSLAKALEARGELLRISRPVDSRHELAAVMARLEGDGKAFLFENVKGSKYPLAGGLFNRTERFGLALGRPPGSPYTHADLDRHIEQAKANPVLPRMVSDAPSKAVVLTGSEIRLQDLPVPTFFELDTGAFITAAIGIARNPRTGALNAGFYRTLILGDDIFAINASSLSDLRRFYQHAEQNGEEMSIALAIGVEPSLLFAAACKLPPTVSEFDIAGGIKGAPIEMVKAETSDLPVPANAEFIIEGKVDFSRRVNNVLGEYAGQYGPESAPVTRVVAITHRRDPIFYSIMAGKNPEHNTIGNIATYGIQRDLSAKLLQLSPAIRKIKIFTEPKLGPMVHIVMAIAKTDDEQPKQLIRQAFAAPGSIFPVSRIARRIVIVDEDIDIESLEDVEWAIWTRVADASKVIVIPGMQSWELDRASSEKRGSMRLGIDATMDMADRAALVRPRIPGFDNLRLEDYVGKPPGRSVA